MKNLLWTMQTILMLTVGTVSALAVAADYTVQVSAEVQNSPAQIKLSWAQDMYGVPTSYTVYRRAPEATNWSAVVTLPGTETSFIDTSVTTQTDYEYQVEKIAVGYTGYGYVLAGIEAPLTEFRGKVILIVDNTYAADLANELALLQQDLAGDGWMVLRHDVSRSDNVSSVKALIQADYFADTNSVKSVFLFGHVPVPYSGNIVPDGHVPDHQGAWPADVFYGDMDGSWTDNSVNNSAAYNARNWNVPGDGKFDQSIVTTGVELEVGRVDLSDLPSFALSEKELLRQYLNKDHNFRHKLITAERRGVIHDSFASSSMSAFAPSGWRNFGAFFGASNITAIAPTTWFSTLSTDSYLWAYGCGGGTFTSAGGVGCTADYAANNPKAVFNMLFGSYFGDWDSTDNLMRASLATPSYGLTCGWAGRPHWFLHQMGLGETIGSGTRLTQNNGNGGLYKQVNAGSLQVHVALMGDPTLRMHPVAPPTSVVGTVSPNEVALNWTESSEPVLGYFVYRATNPFGPFTRLTPTLIIGTSFSDTSMSTGSYIYMVRAIKLESTGGGSYYNASQGAFCSVSGIVVYVTAPAGLTASAISASQINLSWVDNSFNEDGFIVARSLTAGGPYTDFATLPANTTTFTDGGLTPNTTYFYIVRAFNSTASSAYPSEASATTQPAPTPPAAPGSLTATTASSTQISLAWSDNSSTEDYFVLARSLTAGGPYTDVATLPANTTAFLNTGLAANTKFHYVVRAVNVIGASGNSSEATATTQPAPTAPAAPSNLIVTAVSRTQINLAWRDNSSNETNFTIERKRGNATWATIATFSANTTSFSDTTGTRNTSYTYRVKATNAVGSSAYSNTSTVKTLK